MLTRRNFIGAAATVGMSTNALAGQISTLSPKGDKKVTDQKLAYPKIGVYSSVASVNMSEYSAEVRALGAAGISSVYVDEDRDALLNAAALLSAGGGVDIATGWCVPGRTPVLLAKAASWLDAFSGERFTLGIGINSPVVASFVGFSWADRHPLLLDYLTAVRRVLHAPAGSPVEYKGPYFNYAAHGFSDRDSRRVSPPIMIKVTDLPQFEMAGATCDGVALGQMTPLLAYAASGSDLVAAGAKSAERDLTSFRVDKMVWTMIDDDSTKAISRLKGLIASKIVDKSFDNKELAVQAGFSNEVNEITARFAAGDKPGAAQAVSDKMWRAYGLAGTPEEVRAQAASYAGKVDTLICMGAMFGLPDFATYLREHLRITSVIAPR